MFYFWCIRISKIVSIFIFMTIMVFKKFEKQTIITITLLIIHKNIKVVLVVKVLIIYEIFHVGQYRSEQSSFLQVFHCAIYSRFLHITSSFLVLCKDWLLQKQILWSHFRNISGTISFDPNYTFGKHLLTTMKSWTS